MDSPLVSRVPIPYHRRVSEWLDVLKYLLGTVVAFVVTYLMLTEADILVLGALVVGFFGVLFAVRTVGEVASNLGWVTD